MYRMIGAALIALAAALLIGPRLIRYLKKLHFGQTIYELGPSHQQKQGTPVMGGLMMAAGILRRRGGRRGYKWPCAREGRGFAGAGGAVPCGI